MALQINWVYEIIAYWISNVNIWKIFLKINQSEIDETKRMAEHNMLYISLYL